MKLKKTDSMKIDKRISIALLSGPIILAVQYFFITYSNYLGLNIQTYIQNFSKIFVGSIFLIVFPWAFLRSNIKMIIIYLFMSILYISHYLIFTQNSVYLIELSFQFFLISLLGFTYSMGIKNWDIFHKMTEIAANLIFLIGLLFALFVFLGIFDFNEYSMSLSYYMLIPSIIYLNKIIKKFSPRYIILFLVSMIVILALGSRGAVLCVLIFIFLKALSLLKYLTLKKIYIGIIIFILTIFLSLNLKSIFEYLFNFLYYQFDIYSRSLDMFITDGNYSSGRDDLYSHSIKVLMDYPFGGVGLAGDRVILQSDYVHNIFLEVLLNFGILIGLIIIISYIILIFYCLFVVKVNNELIIIWFTIGFCPLLVSGSYLADIEFWIFNGLLVSTLLIKRKQNAKKSLYNT